MVVTPVELDNILLVPPEKWESLDQFSNVGNRARYGFIELDMSTGLDEQINLGKPYSVCRVMCATELGTGLIELDISTGLDEQIDLDKPYSICRYRARLFEDGE